MSSATQQRLRLHERPSQHPEWKHLFLYASPLLVLLLAFSLTNHNPNPIPILLSSFSSSSSSHTDPTPPQSSSSPRPPCVRWMAPFLSACGYSSEAWSFISALHHHASNTTIRLKIDHHGDLQDPDFWYGLPKHSQDLAFLLYNTHCEPTNTIVVCHSEPGAWLPPLFRTFPCPPAGYELPLAVVGRTMFETDRLNPDHADRCNRMDEVWVPTEFHVSTFIASGVEREKVAKLVQPVDVDFFDPAKHRPMTLPVKNPILGDGVHDSEKKKLAFLSIFKWEHRKGWDVLLKSYLQEFSSHDNVALFLLISAFHSDANFGAKITDFVEKSGLEEPENGWAPVYLINEHIPQVELPRIYKAADVFVLPTRGEGWGRPVVEAMAMELPVIVTNWSGLTEYLTEENGYPLPVEQMTEVPEGPFKGHLWAEPSVEQLKFLMRHVVENVDQRRRKGKRARRDMVERFSPEVVARIVVDRIKKIVEKSGYRSGGRVQ